MICGARRTLTRFSECTEHPGAYAIRRDHRCDAVFMPGVGTISSRSGSEVFEAGQVRFSSQHYGRALVRSKEAAEPKQVSR